MDYFDAITMIMKKYSWYNVNWRKLENVMGFPSFSSAQSLNCVRLFATPWTAALQASLSITHSQSLPIISTTKNWKQNIEIKYIKTLWWC